MVFYLAFRNLFRNRRRSLAILLTIALGSGALFAFKGFITGVLDDYKESTIHCHYGHGQINTKGYRETVYAEPWKHWIEEPAKIEQFLNNQPEVLDTFPRVGFSALLSKGNITLGGFGQGIEAAREDKFFHGLHVQSGIGLTHQEDGILLGCSIAKALGVSSGDSVTVTVQAADGSLSRKEFIVSDTFHTGKQDVDSKLFRIQLHQAQNLLKTTSIETIALGLSEDADWQMLAKKIDEQFPELEATSFEVLDAIFYQHSVNWLNAQFHVVNVIILAILLLGIFNTVSASVLERKQEIGNFRANGESRWEILQLILSEGILLGIIGAAIGITLSYIFLTTCLENNLLMPAGPGLTKQFYIHFSFNWHMVGASLLLSIVSAMAASIFAGVKIVRMPIASALRAV